MLTWYDCRNRQDTGLAILVEDSVVLGEGFFLQADLMSIHTTKREQVAFGAAGQRVMRTAVNVGDVVFLKLADDARDGDDSVGLARKVGVAGLRVVVQAPGPELASVVDVESRVGAGGDLDSVAGFSEASANRRVQARLRPAPSRNRLPRKLRLAATAPGVDFAILVQRKHVVRPCSQTDNLGQAGDLHRLFLHLNVRSESKNAIGALLVSVVSG